MDKNFKEFRVFIASPGDLSPERKVFRDTIDTINKGYGEGAKIKFIPYGWEDELATTGFRVQSVINEQVDASDIFVLVLHRRWGQKVENPNYSSYTEEEFYRAYNRWKKMQNPVIMIFFKYIDAATLADPGEQLKQVLKFKEELNKMNVLFKPFATETDFGIELDNHLRGFAEGRWDVLNDHLTKIEISEKNLESLKKAEMNINKKIEEDNNQEKNKEATANIPTLPDISLVMGEKESLALTRAAITASNAGNIEDAKLLFAKATAGTTNFSILSVVVEFYRQIGDNSNANELVRRLSAITNDREIAVNQLLKLLPVDFIKGLQTTVIQNFDAISGSEEGEDMVNRVFDEMNRRGIWERYFIDSMVRNYTTAEIMAQAQLYSTAEGQALVYKQPHVLAEGMEFGAYAFSRINAELMSESFPTDRLISVYDKVLEITPLQKKLY